jgi:phosphoglycolate phosphatase
MIKSVIFDIDGVLIDSFNANLDYYQRLMVAAGYRKPPKSAFKGGFWLTTYDQIKRLTKTQNEIELRRIWLLAQTIPFKKRLFKKPKGVIEVIKQLAKKYKLAIATSRTKYGVAEAMDFLGAKKYFKAIVAFEDFKHPKPDPESLLLAMKKLKAKFHETVFIGDSLSDAQAAEAAGIKFIAFYKKPLSEAGYYTTSFDQLLKIIKTL